MSTESTRNGPAPLSYEQQLQLTEIASLEADFSSLCNRIGKSRELSLAVTNIEQAAMWARRHVAGAVK